jgi:hypothetical protein
MCKHLKICCICASVGTLKTLREKEQVKNIRNEVIKIPF